MSLTDLALDPPAGVAARGFDPLEVWPNGRWRWANGAEQTVEFALPAGQHRISYRAYLPETGGDIVFSVAGISLSLRAAYPGEMVQGSIEFSLAQPQAVVARFQSSSSLPARPFALHNLRVKSNSPELADLPFLPAEKLRAGQIPAFFCAYPFRSAFFGQSGQTYPCCYSMVPGEEAIGVAGIADFAVPEAWNSPLLRSVRREMLAGRVPAACGQCHALEAVGAQSPRQEYNRAWPEGLELAQLVDRSGRTEASPALLDVQLGNTCNLRCRMCGPSSSVGLIDEHTALTGQDFSHFRQMFWRNNSTMLKKLAADAHGLRELNVIGGEPLLTKEYFELLRNFAASGQSRNISLRMNTNLTVLPAEARELFAQFAGVTLVVSLEGVGAVNDYIRYPAKFSVIERNLRELHENGTAWNLREVGFNTTVQAYNVFRLPELFRHLHREFPRFAWFPRLALVQDPEELSVLVLPDSSREAAARALEEFAQETAGLPEHAGIKAQVASAAAYLRAPGRPDLREKFRRRHELFDRSRGQSLPYSIPGLEL